MKNNKFTCCGFVLFCIMLCQPAFSLSSDNMSKASQVKSVQSKQARSINQGINLGKLTPKEAKKLQAEQLAISSLETAMMEDGVVTSEELAVIFARLEMARKHINHLSRNSISTSAKQVEVAVADKN